MLTFLRKAANQFLVSDVSYIEPLLEWAFVDYCIPLKFREKNLDFSGDFSTNNFDVKSACR